MNDIESARLKTLRNIRVQARYDQLIAEGKHGHYESMFRVVREEVERALVITRETTIAECASVADAARESAKEHHGVEASIGADIAARRIRALVSTTKVPQ